MEPSSKTQSPACWSSSIIFSFFGSESCVPNLDIARAPAAQANFTASFGSSPTAQEAARAPAKASALAVWSTISSRVVAVDYEDFPRGHLDKDAADAGGNEFRGDQFEFTGGCGA